MGPRQLRLGQRIAILPGNPHPCLRRSRQVASPCLPCLRAGTGRPGGEGISARCGGLIEAGVNRDG